MPRNENPTYRELIEPALKSAGSVCDRGVIFGPGRINLANESMYDETQQLIADYMRVPQAFGFAMPRESAPATAG